MTIEKTLPFLILCTVGLSALLLGMGQGDFEPLFVAILGASAAFMFVDWLKWFRLPQWLANSLAVIVTVITVSNFYFTNDSVRHLLGVGKLLVYLQTILLFQRKSSRVYWQVLVLSLLQIVVGAVFNLGFEGGVLFIVYMMVAGVTMMLLHLYQDRQINRIRNEEYLSWSAEGKSAGMVRRPIALSSNTNVSRAVLRRMIGSFSVFAFGALFFSILLFYFLPRDHSSWSGPQEVPMRVTGFDKKVTLDHKEMILLSTKLQMNVRYWYPGKEKEFRPGSEPYLRGIALSNIRIDGNKTNWVPPPYQIYKGDFRPLRAGRTDERFVVQEIVLEPTEDPLLYSVMPPRVSFDNELVGDFEWCWPLGGLSRQLSDETITVSHFRYDLHVPILENGAFHSAYPYQPRNGPISLTEETDPGNYKWLTYLDRQRYPTIVDVGEQISRQADDDHYSLARQMEAWFSTDRFDYTLDFRNVKRNESIDSTEDFFANFRSGHCEYYASALALMLRSQGVPSRVVVGYRGGDVNDFGGHLDVESRHAHAWVEAYIRPGDCPDEMIRTGQANDRRGAWLRLDPTPAVDMNSLASDSDDALDFAKSLWRDYVLGLQSESRSRIMSNGRFRMSGLFRVLDLDWWQQSFKNVIDKLKEPDGWKPFAIPVAVFVVLLILWSLFIIRKRKAQPTQQAAGESGKQAGWLRRSMARVARVVSPTLGDWIAGPGSQSEKVEFYARLESVLQRAGYEKLPQQTQREFARNVASSISANADSETETSQPGNLITTVVDYYYLVRFGDSQLNEDQASVVEQALTDLETQLT